MTVKTSGDSIYGVSGIIFGEIQDSFTTQEIACYRRSRTVRGTFKITIILQRGYFARTFL
jgi:hypothetical protein